MKTAPEDRANIFRPDPLASTASKNISFLYFHLRNMDVILSTVRFVDYTNAETSFPDHIEKGQRQSMKKVRITGSRAGAVARAPCLAWVQKGEP
jgi:hypothetical protein